MTSDSEQPNTEQSNCHSAASGNTAPCGDKADGGPAFPSIAPEFTGIDSDGVERYENGPTGGMSLRDYFAAKAMHQFMHGAVLPTGYDATPELDLIASRAYEAADAMLKARKA